MTMTDNDQTVARLAKRIDDLEAELERRDVEQMELEGVVEFLEQRASTHLWVLGWLVNHLCDDRCAGCRRTDMLDRLYDAPRDEEHGFRQARFVDWKRPARRWTQFGAKRDLQVLADEAGARARQGDNRETLIRGLWREGVLPGGVGPHTRTY